MCTAITYKGENFYFGRNLDYDHSFGETVILMPRNYDIKTSSLKPLGASYAVLGMGCVASGFPLFFDAINEAGLCCAGLNFVGNAFYQKPSATKCNVAQYEFIPWLLARCANVFEAEKAILKINLTDSAFSENMPPAQLHWLIADKERCITLEVSKSGTQIHENPVGILTNNPPFPFQMFALNNYAGLSPSNPNPTFGNINFPISSPFPRTAEEWELWGFREIIHHSRDL